nr:type IV pilin-like G/H family protein [Chroococcidiopsis sp. TS-821]
MPSFLNQSAKARASEARTNVGAMNRSQQTYYLENQKFAEGKGAIDKLGIGIKDSTNYAYEAVTASSADQDVINKAKSLNKDLKGHIGGVFSVGGQTPSILCQAKEPALETTTPMNAPTNTDGTLACGANTEKVGG